MLLYAMLHLAGVKDGRRRARASGELAVTLDDIKRFRQLDSRCPDIRNISVTAGVETTTGPLGQGCGNERRHGDRRALAGEAFQPARLRCLRLRRLRHVQRRRHDGGRHQRGRFARRPSDARQPLLDLRRQPHHDRRPHRPRFQRRRGGAFSRLRLERAARRRRQRHRADRARRSRSSGGRTTRRR